MLVKRVGPFAGVNDGAALPPELVQRQAQGAAPSSPPLPYLFQYRRKVMPDRAAIVQFAIQGPEGFDPHRPRHQPGAMIAKAGRDVPCPFGGEAVGERARRKAHALPLQPVTVDPGDRDIFGMGRMKGRIAAQLHQATAAQRKAAIADIMPIGELGPTGADIVISQKVGMPTRCVQHMAVPLDGQAMAGLDMIDQLRQEKIGIGPR